MILPAYPDKAGWYCIVMLDAYEQPEYGSILKLEIASDGEHTWWDESGDEVDHIFDPFLQLNVGMQAAEGYVPQ